MSRTGPEVGAAAESPAAPPGRRWRLGGFAGFSLLVAGQLVSLIGSGLTRFALGVWVFERTGSATQFTLIAVFASLPGIALSPFAGALVDRWDRRRTMLGADAFAAAATLGVVLLAAVGSLNLTAIYLLVAASSLADAFQWPASVAATTLLVPKQHLGRASGLIQFGQAAAQVLVPLPAALLMVAVGLRGVLFIDFATFLFAAATLLFIRVPRTPAAPAAGGRPNLWREAAYGWTFIRERAGLLGLLVFFATVNLAFSMAVVLVIPLVMSFAGKAAAGGVLTTANAGLLAGSVVMSVTGGPRRRIHGVLGLGLVAALAMAAVGLRPDLPMIGGALFVMMSTVPIVNGCSQAIWQTKTPPQVQGRVFAMRRMIAQFTAPLGFLAAGPLADRLLEPAMAAGGPLAGSVGRLLGTGPGRGIGLLYLVAALLPLTAALISYARRPVRRVEEELPDAIADRPPGEP